MGEYGFDSELFNPVKKLRFTTRPDEDELNTSTSVPSKSAGGKHPVPDETLPYSKRKRVEQGDHNSHKQEIRSSDKILNKDRHDITIRKNRKGNSMQNKADCKESPAAAKKPLTYSCHQEKAISDNAVLKPEFSNDFLSAPEASAQETLDCSVSRSLSLNPHTAEIRAEGKPHNSKMADEENSIIMERVETESVRRFHELDKKHQQEIQDFHSHWGRKKAVLDKDYDRESNRIFSTYDRPVRTRKLDKLYNEYTSELKECTFQKDICLKNIQDRQLVEKNKESQRATQWLDEVTAYRAQDEGKKVSSSYGFLTPRPCGIRSIPETIQHAKTGYGISEATADFDVTNSCGEVNSMAFEKASTDRVEQPRRADGCGISEAAATVDVTNSCDEVKKMAFEKASTDRVQKLRRTDVLVDIDKDDDMSLSPSDPKSPDGGTACLQAEAIQNVAAKVTDVMQTGIPAVEELTIEMGSDGINSVNAPTERVSQKESFHITKKEETNLSGEELKLTEDLSLYGLQKLKKPKLLRDHIPPEATSREPLDPRGSSHFGSVKVQSTEIGVEGRPENSEKGNSEVIKQIPKKCGDRMMELKKKHKQETQEIRKSWKRKCELLSEHHKRESARICSIYGPSVGSDKLLKELDNQITLQMKEYECQMNKCLKDLGDKQLHEKNEERQKAAHCLEEANSYERELCFHGSKSEKEVVVLDTVETQTPAVEESKKENEGRHPDNLNSVQNLEDGADRDAKTSETSSRESLSFVQLHPLTPNPVFQNDSPQSLEMAGIDSMKSVVPNVDEPMTRKEALYKEESCTPGKLLSSVQAEEVPTESHETAPKEAVTEGVKINESRISDINECSTGSVGEAASDPNIVLSNKDSGANCDIGSQFPATSVSVDNTTQPVASPHLYDLLPQVFQNDSSQSLEMAGIDSTKIVAPNVDEPMTRKEALYIEESCTPGKLLSSVQAEEVPTEGHVTAPKEAMTRDSNIVKSRISDINECSTESIGEDASDPNIVLANKNNGANCDISSQFPATSIFVDNTTPQPVASPHLYDLLPPNPVLQDVISPRASVNPLEEFNSCSLGVGTPQRSLDSAQTSQSCVDLLVGHPNEPHISPCTRLPVAQNQADLCSPGRVLNLPLPSERLPNPSLYANDPIQIEIERLCKEKEQIIKLHQDLNMKLKFDQEKEILELTAQIKRKYEAKNHEVEVAFLEEKREIDRKCRIVLMNRNLAWLTRSRDMDQRFAEALLMQQGFEQSTSSPHSQNVHQLAALQSSSTSAPCSASRFSGFQQPPAPPHWQALQSCFALAPSSAGQFPVLHQLVFPRVQNVQQSAAPSGNTTRNPSTNFPNLPSGNLYTSHGIRAPAPHLLPTFRPAPFLQSISSQQFLMN